MKLKFYIFPLFFFPYLLDGQNISTLLNYVETENTTQLEIIQKSGEIFSNENYKYGIRYLKSKIKKEPFYDGLLFIAYGYRKQKKYDKSLQYFHSAITQSPKKPLGYFLRGNTYLEMEKYRLALQDYKKCIKQDSLFYQAYNNMALLKIKNQGGSRIIHRNDLKYAEKILSSILGCNEETSSMEDVCFNLGLVQLNLHHYSDAICFFNKALYNDNIKYKAIFYRGVSNFKLKQYKQAESDFQKAKDNYYKIDDCNEYLQLIEHLNQ